MKRADRHFRNLVILAAIIFALAGCLGFQNNQVQADVNANLDTPFLLKQNQTAFLASENLMIRFLDIQSDSRCPIDVQCIWAGEAEARLGLQLATDAGSTGLFTEMLLVKGAGDDASVKVFKASKDASYSIKLIRVDPYPRSNTTKESRDYTITLSVSKA